MRYKIGDTAWRAAWDSAQDWITCPDCAGHKFGTVILGSGEQHTIDCGSCGLGYNPPTGRIVVYKRNPTAERVTITGAELSKDGVEYRTSGSYCVKDEDLFDTFVGALARAAVRCAEIDQAERDRILQKEKPARTWAFHVSYHRREAKRHRQEAERHEAKLAVARAKVKEEA